MTSLCFITPVWERYELTEIVLKSRKLVCDELANHGISASSVIIGDDDNLDIAGGLGFPVVERDNEFLSQKFNDGYQFAFNNGFDYCYPVGSDSLLTADQFLTTLGMDTPVASHYYSIIHNTGTERIDVKITVPGGIGPLIIPVHMLERFPRPIPENLTRGCDNAARQTILRADIKIAVREEHQWEHVAFQSGVTQITDYDRIRRVYRADRFKINYGKFRELEERYDKETIDGIFDYYYSGRSQIA